MNFWIGIIFFCAGESCYFFKPSIVFQSQESCLKEMSKALDSVKESKAYINCMLVDLNKTI